MRKTCVSCKFFKRGGWLSIRGDICKNPKCDELAWKHVDVVTGEVTEYERRNKECRLARYNPCGSQAIYWEER